MEKMHFRQGLIQVLANIFPKYMPCCEQQPGYLCFAFFLGVFRGRRTHFPFLLSPLFFSSAPPQGEKERGGENKSLWLLPSPCCCDGGTIFFAASPHFPSVRRPYYYVRHMKARAQKSAISGSDARREKQLAEKKRNLRAEIISKKNCEKFHTLVYWHQFV